jgi:hypothetical protein
MGAPEMPEVWGQWTSGTLGKWTEGGEETITLIESVTTVYTDGSWVRAGHDPRDPLRQHIESSEDEGNCTTGEQLMAMYRSFARMGAGVTNALTATLVSVLMAGLLDLWPLITVAWRLPMPH